MYIFLILFIIVLSYAAAVTCSHLIGAHDYVIIYVIVGRLDSNAISHICFFLIFFPEHYSPLDVYWLWKT